MNTNFLKKLDDATLNTILTAQLDDLIERRNVRDDELFRKCFEAESESDELNTIEKIENFGFIATTAFAEYHKERATQSKADESEDQ